MERSKQCVDQIDVRNKRVFLRADFNVPLDGDMHITDDRRIRSALPTINYLIDEGAKVILASHLGRPKGAPDPRYTMAPVAKRLSRLLSKEVNYTGELVGPAVEREIEKLAHGEVFLLENLRFDKGEETNDEEFSKKLARLADVYVNDTFGTTHLPTKEAFLSRALECV